MSELLYYTVQVYCTVLYRCAVLYMRTVLYRCTALYRCSVLYRCTALYRCSVLYRCAVLYMCNVLYSNLFFFTRLESLAWSQQDFWQASFCRNCNLWSLCYDGRNKVGFLCIVCMEKGRVDTSSLFILSSNSTHSLSYRKAMKRSTTLFPTSKQRLHKSQFLQKLSCQTPYWDHAILSSLVNKQVAVQVYCTVHMYCTVAYRCTYSTVVYSAVQYNAVLMASSCLAAVCQ